MWSYNPHQIEDGQRIHELLHEHKIALITSEERTAKSGGFLYYCENDPDVHKVLIITKNAAQAGWQEHLDNLPITKDYHIIGHHGFNYAPRLKYDVIVIDESHHTFCGYPNPGKIVVEWHKTGLFDKVPMVFMSATMVSRSYASMYHQLVLCDYSPFAKFKNFRDWFRTYGIPKTKFLGSRQIPMFDETEGVMEVLEHLIVDRTRKELGFEFEAEDLVTQVPLGDRARELYNEAVKDQILTVPEASPPAPDDIVPILTKPQENTILHQIEGGTINILDTETEDRHIAFVDITKIQYILDKYGDTEELVIFYHFQLEQKLLLHNFKKARILQGITYSAGVDLHKYRYAVVYSMDYSTANYSQRRNRQVNMKREWPIVVEHLITKGAISEKIYNTVAVNKKDFIDSMHENNTI